MENENFYQTNLETGKLNIHTTKPFYDALNDEKQMVFKRYCLWSNRQQLWISKGKAENCSYLKSRLNEMGFAQVDAVGEKLSFEQRVERQQAKAGERAERAEQLSEKAEVRSDALYLKAKDMASVIPFGQPILVGHHSEKRDRNYRGRIDNTFRKAFEESDKANYYSDKAETAKFTAEGKQYSNPFYLDKRIKETQTSIRQIERRLKGKFYSHSPESEINDKTKAFYNDRLSDEKDKLNFYEKCMIKIDPNWAPKIPSAKKGKGKSI